MNPRMANGKRFHKETEPPRKILTMEFGFWTLVNSYSGVCVFQIFRLLIKIPTLLDLGRLCW